MELNISYSIQTFELVFSLTKNQKHLKINISIEQQFF